MAFDFQIDDIQAQESVWRQTEEKLMEEARHAAEQYRQYQEIIAAYTTSMHQYALMIPQCLHLLGISNRRTKTERKEERSYEKVEYVQIEQMYFDWDAFYYKIAMPLPDGNPYSKLAAPEVVESLEKTFIAKVSVNYSDSDDNPRRGVWLTIESKRGRNLVPSHTKWSEAIKSCPKGSLIFPIGYGARGKLYTFDFHVGHNFLGAGMKGSGKSNLANQMICTLLRNNTPKELRLLAVDFKRVEMSPMNGLPHMGGEVWWTIKGQKAEDLPEEEDDDDDETPKGKIKVDTRLKTWLRDDPKRPAHAKAPIGKTIVGRPAELMLLLDYILAEIERRLDVMVRGKCRNMKQFNKKHPDKAEPVWLLIIDELGQLDQLGSKEKQIAMLKLMRIVEIGRAAWIYTSYFTQTPNSDVLPTRVRANIPAAVAFYCGSPMQSLAILGNHDAHKKLPDHPGRAIFDWGRLREVVQVPEISDWHIEQVFKAAHNRKDEPVKPQYKIDPIRVFQWVLEENEGEAGIIPIYKQFRNEVGRNEIERILRDYQVNGHVTPIPIGEQTYMLLPPMPNENSILNQSRKLVPYTPPAPHETGNNEPTEGAENLPETPSPPAPVTETAPHEPETKTVTSPPQNTNGTHGTQKKLTDKEKLLVEYLLENPDSTLNQVFKATGVPKNPQRLAILSDVKQRLEAEKC